MYEYDGKFESFVQMFMGEDDRLMCILLVSLLSLLSSFSKKCVLVCFSESLQNMRPV